MNIVHETSLAATVDALDEIWFDGRALPKAAANKVAAWLAGRQGINGSYGRLIAPTPQDYVNKAKLFTGEAVTSGAGMGFKFGIEGATALVRLGVPAATSALEPIDQWVWGKKIATTGRYCCMSCSCSLWRYLAACGTPRCEAALARGLRMLKAKRDGKGRWQNYPFHYALLALSEMDLPAAMAELRYAAVACERAAKRTVADKYGRRRQALALRVLAKC